ncbi:hypothetical protein D9758_007962 [Tetrapyrgos nigripes]|uniref:Uncharacterized protein n=1 Tax=Tetrapyrgos nigripes TaxID=182062 RepID=A0A8H5D3L1_9AGAR|nr:hypothetical protein D9758_007962 [Tetrapyrgos nigripes]
MMRTAHLLPNFRSSFLPSSARVARPLRPCSARFTHRSISSSTSSRTSDSSSTRQLRDAQNKNTESPLAPIGVAAAVQAKQDPSSVPARPKIFDEFALRDRVGIVSGGNNGLGLEMAMALCEAGARAVYTFDVEPEPSEDWVAVKEFVEKMGSRLEYANVDVTDQKKVWEHGDIIGDKEGRMDFCVAAAGVMEPHTPCLGYTAEQYRRVTSINCDGALFTAQAAGRQMERFGLPGSIVLIASMSGSITNQGDARVAYNSSKSAVIQMARSLACELAPLNIRVNSLSPGHIYTKLTAQYLDTDPGLLDKWSNLNPMGRIGRIDEIRGPIIW